MFAVPGWSISASEVKVQQAEPKKVPQNGVNEAGTDTKSKKNNSKKRKHGKIAGDVTWDNVDTLWKEVVEKREPVKKSKGPQKNAAGKNSGQDHGIKDDVDTATAKGATDDTGSSVRPKIETVDDEATQRRKAERRKAKYERRKAEQAAKHGTSAAAVQADSKNEDGVSKDGGRDQPKSDKVVTIPTEKDGHTRAQNSTTDAKTHTVPEAPAFSISKLTPLQQKMAQKLVSARFRHLNEELYTTSSTSAKKLFATNPDAFTSYHEGFRAQVASWPSNPISGFIDDMKRRAALQLPSQKNMARRATKGGKHASMDDDKSHIRGRLDLIPRDHKTSACRIIDLGCGDAQFARSLSSVASPKKLNLHIRSFDLVANDASLITAADITDLRSANVTDSSIDVAICCLSLMGLNWVKVVDECARCVRAGGEVWIAEIRSRLQRPDLVKNGSKGGNIGRMKNDGKSGMTSTKKKGKDEDDAEEIDEESMMADLEIPKKKDHQTDVSAFVAVWQRRGFSLKEPADMDNKMFVKLRFLKDKVPDHKVEAKAMNGRQPLSKKFLDDEDRNDGPSAEDEASVLKPCVYKTR